MLLAVTAAAAAVGWPGATRARSAGPALFTSSATGPVALAGIGGNTPNPLYGAPPTRLYLELADRSKRAVFGRLVHDRTRIASATIDDPASSMRYTIRGIVTTGVAVHPPSGAQPSRVYVTLAVEHIVITLTRARRSTHF